jgi:hypothetical protein
MVILLAQKALAAPVSVPYRDRQSTPMKEFPVKLWHATEAQRHLPRIEAVVLISRRPSTRYGSEDSDQPDRWQS